MAESGRRMASFFHRPRLGRATSAPLLTVLFPTLNPPSVCPSHPTGLRKQAVTRKHWSLIKQEDSAGAR
jgi:hypothetical protein